MTNRFFVLLPLSLAVACGGSGSDGDGSGPAAVEIAACGEITTSGRYRLAADVPDQPRDEPCVVVRDTHDVTLDCGGRTITGFPALLIERVDGFRIEHCRFASVAAGPSLGFAEGDPRTGVLRIRGSADGVVTHVTIGPPDVFVHTSHDVELSDSELDASYTQFASQRIRVARNRMTAPFPEQLTGSVFWSVDGADNEVVDNVLDGAWNRVRDPGVARLGADDGILLFDERGIRISGNTITNVWDCGIENVGLLADATIERNRISNAAYCGIGGWYWSSVRNVVFAENDVRESCAAFLFRRVNGLRAGAQSRFSDRPPEDLVYFQGNRFEGNRLAQYAEDCSAYASFVPLYDDMAYDGSVRDASERVPGPGDFALADNTFRDNDFGTAPIWFGQGAVAAGRVIDGGGNRCSMLEGYPSPLRCE